MAEMRMAPKAKRSHQGESLRFHPACFQYERNAAFLSGIEKG
jgi:hypothetical protein